MRVLSLGLLRDLQLQFPAAEASLGAWWNTVKPAKWKSLSDVKKTYPNAKLGDRNAVGFVFDEGTLYATVHFATGTITIQGFEEDYLCAVSGVSLNIMSWCFMTLRFPCLGTTVAPVRLS